MNVVTRYVNTSSSSYDFIISVCLFCCLGSLLDDGGGILISGSGGKIMMKENVFSSCVSKNGGGFHISGLNEINCEQCCMIKCNSKEWGHGFLASAAVGGFIRVFHNSFVHCSENLTFGRTSIEMLYANQFFTLNNASKCVVSTYDVVLHWVSVQFTNTYNHCADNTVSIAINVAESKNGIVEYSNFINNTKSFNKYGLIYLYTNTRIDFKSSLFFDNYQQNFLSGVNLDRAFFTGCVFYNNRFDVSTSLVQTSLKCSEIPIIVLNTCQQMNQQSKSAKQRLRQSFLLFIFIS